MPRPITVVLIVGFVVAGSARLSQEGLPGSVERVPVAPARPGAGEAQIVLHYSADRRIRINDEEVPRDALKARLQTLYRLRSDRTMWLDGDGSLRYGEIVDVMDAAKAAGVERVGVITPGMRGTR